MAENPKPGDKNLVNPNLDVLKLVGDLNRRVRGLEESFGNTRERLDMVDDSMHDNLKNLREDLINIHDELKMVTTVIEELKITFSQMVKQLSVFARKSDMLALEKYVDLMDPTRYLVEEEIKELILQVLSKKLKGEEVV